MKNPTGSSRPIFQLDNMPLRVHWLALPTRHSPCTALSPLKIDTEYRSTVEALLSHTPPSHEKCMGYEGLWEDRERLHARLAGISVPNVMKGINGQSKGIGKSLGMT